MRRSTFATLAFLATFTGGAGAIDRRHMVEGWYRGNGTGELGMSQDHAVFIQGEGSPHRQVSLLHAIPARLWRGQRVAIMLRLKKEGTDTAGVSLRLTRSDEITTLVEAQKTGAAEGWETQRLVLDVPESATGLAVDAHFTGKGTIWVAGFELEPAAVDAPVTPHRSYDRWLESTCMATAEGDCVMSPLPLPRQ